MIFGGDWGAGGWTAAFKGLNIYYNCPSPPKPLFFRKTGVLGIDVYHTGIVLEKIKKE